MGRIDFLADEADAPDSPPAPAPASASAPPRRRIAAAGPAASAPARRVTCEFSTRYQLMLCY